MFGERSSVVYTAVMKLADVKVAKDHTLNVQEWEEKKKAARGQIKVARKHLTQETGIWEKMLAKFEGKVKKERSI